VNDAVGPVLESNDVARAIIAAIREANTDVQVHDRGAYLRVLVPGRCAVQRVTIERLLGRPFSLPADLELVMPSFKGTITISDDEVVWR
jgi:toluene monooxygenase system protein D